MTRDAGKETRRRLLDAASDVFAEQGFEKATVREICERAKANVAAVNYHFRSKRELYARVLAAWRSENDERYPLHGGLPRGAPVGDRLRAFYAAVLRRVFLSGGDLLVAQRRARVLMREITADPGREGVGGIRLQGDEEGWIRSLIIDALGSAPPLAVQDCADSCLGQVSEYLINFIKNPDEFHAMSDKGEIERVAGHMTLFALGGIEGMQRAAGSRGSARAYGGPPARPARRVGC